MAIHAPACGFNHECCGKLVVRLRPTGGIDRMAAMLRKKAIRTYFSFAALVALLLCQAAWAASWPAFAAVWQNWVKTILIGHADDPKLIAAAV
jgi:hypothetical protein